MYYFNYLFFERSSQRLKFGVDLRINLFLNKKLKMKKQQILILSLSFLFNLTYGQVLFTPTPHIIQETDTYEYSVAGDLDNDNTDEVVIFENPLSDHRAIHVFDIDLNGQFIPLQVIDFDSNMGNPVLEDVDNDGDLDIVSFDYGFEIFYFENLGNLENNP